MCLPINQTAHITSDSTEFAQCCATWVNRSQMTPTQLLKECEFWNTPNSPEAIPVTAAILLTTLRAHLALADALPNDHALHGNKGAFRWARSGLTFEDLTLSPRVDASGAGCWHGNLSHSQLTAIPVKPTVADLRIEPPQPRAPDHRSRLD